MRQSVTANSKKKTNPPNREAMTNPLIEKVAKAAWSIWEERAEYPWEKLARESKDKFEREALLTIKVVLGEMIADAKREWLTAAGIDKYVIDFAQSNGIDLEE